MSKNTLYLVIIFLLFPVYLFGQNEKEPSRLLSNWSIHAKYGIPYSYKSEPTYSSFETSIKMLPKTQVIIGAGYRYFFKEKLVSNVEMMGKCSLAGQPTQICATPAAAA